MYTILIIIAIIFDLLFIIPVIDTIILYVFGDELVITKTQKKNL